MRTPNMSSRISHDPSTSTFQVTGIEFKSADIPDTRIDFTIDDECAEDTCDIAINTLSTFSCITISREDLKKLAEWINALQ